MHAGHAQRHAEDGDPGTHTRHGAHRGNHHPYLRFAVMLLLSFIAMYALMYAMVDRWANVHHSLNQAYMAGLMTAPMGLIELALMARMYEDRRRNFAFAAGCVLLGLACWFGIRQQWGIGDRQFLRSMIPHHAGALLMCEQARLRDPELQALCDGIRTSQQREIDFMARQLDRDDLPAPRDR